MFFFHAYLRQNRCFRYFSTCVKSENYKVHAMVLFQLFTLMFPPQPNCCLSLYISFLHCSFSRIAAVRSGMKTMTGIWKFSSCALHITIIKKSKNIELLILPQLFFWRTRKRFTVAYNKSFPFGNDFQPELDLWLLLMLFLTGLLKKSFHHRTMALLKLPLDWSVEKRKKNSGEGS